MAAENIVSFLQRMIDYERDGDPENFDEVAEHDRKIGILRREEKILSDNLEFGREAGASSEAIKRVKNEITKRVDAIQAETKRRDAAIAYLPIYHSKRNKRIEKIEALKKKIVEGLPLDNSDQAMINSSRKAMEINQREEAEREARMRRRPQGGKRRSHKRTRRNHRSKRR
jgi:hypothetical protein